jgi:predicted metal-dependent phosphoesterase TrpH
MDLHIHTCLSPCGMSENVPTRIVKRAVERKLQAIGICDHNASENVEAVRKAAETTGVFVFGGMEITTAEEIHILAIFESDSGLAHLQELVYEALPGKNDPDAFGPQYIVDEEDYVTGFNEKLLMGATNIPLDGVIEAIHHHGGLAIASHIDREAFSIISQLGMIPENLVLDAVELSPHYMSSPFTVDKTAYPTVMFSDAHIPDDIGKAYTSFLIEEASLPEIGRALNGRDGRRIIERVHN